MCDPRVSPKTSSAKPALLIIAEKPPELYSPAGERVRHMALAATSFFSKVVVLSSGTPDKRSKREVHAKALSHKTSVVRSIPYPISALFDPIKLLAFLIRGLALSIRYKPSHIIASMPPVETGASAWCLSRLLRKKLVIDYMDDWEASMRTQLTRYIPSYLMIPVWKLANLIYSFSTTIFVVTPTLAKAIQQRGSNASIVLVPNGADLAIFHCRDEKARRQTRLKHKLNPRKNVLVYCGSANPYYRLDLVLLAAKSLPDYAKEKLSFVFFLYTGLEYSRRLKSLLEIPDELVEIREPLPRKDLSEVMAACDVGLVPFSDELFLTYAMSTKLYEYLSVGLYVISSGPEEGELQSFFTRNPSCGVFVQPTVRNFVRIFSEVLDDGVFEGVSSSSRHSFIARNYDARKIMINAMESLSDPRGGSE
ncbi:MAG: glycosyltransferase [Promethearchaeota archaeon]